TRSEVSETPAQARRIKMPVLRWRNEFSPTLANVNASSAVSEKEVATPEEQIRWAEKEQVIPWSPTMRSLQKADVLAALVERAQAGEHVDSIFTAAVRGSRASFLFKIEDEKTFLSLIWIERDASRLLTPGGPRSLKDVAQRMVEQHLTFERL